MGNMTMPNNAVVCQLASEGPCNPNTRNLCKMKLNLSLSQSSQPVEAEATLSLVSIEPAIFCASGAFP